MKIFKYVLYKIRSIFKIVGATQRLGVNTTMNIV
eukprot:COSAG05_NODE_4333_length_1562_cov_9.159945_1_plen_33_part_01